MPPDRMLYRSCALCVRHKTKCHEVTWGGCYRCRIKGRECSLAGLESDPDPLQPLLTGMPAAGPSTVTERRQSRITELEARCRELEARLEAYSPGSQHGISASEATTSTLPPGSNPFAADESDYRLPYRQMDAFSVVKAILQPPTSFVFDERVFGAIDSDGYPSALKRGLLSEYQFNFAFAVAKDRINKLMSIPSFDEPTCPPPTHPFIQLACLMHVPGFLSPEIDHKLHLMVDESVLYSLAGAVNKDVVVALYILSMAPAPLSSDRHLPTTPLRLISLAYGFAQDIGLGGSRETVRAHPDGTIDTRRKWRPSYRDEDQRLLESIETRHQLLHIQFSRCKATYPWDQVHRVELEGLVAAPDHQYQDELDGSRICRSSAGLIEWLARQEVDKDACWPSAEDCDVQWRRFADGIAFEPSSAQLPEVSRMDAKACAFALAIRIACLFQINIAVISPEAFADAQRVTGRIILDASAEHIQAFMRSRLSLMPQYLTQHFVCAVMTLRRTHFITQRLYPGVEVIDLEQLEAAEKIMDNMKGLPAKCLDQLWYQLQVDESQALGYSMAFGWDETADSDSARSAAAV